jgi:hypothetical protein
MTSEAVSNIQALAVGLWGSHGPRHHADFSNRIFLRWDRVQSHDPKPARSPISREPVVKGPQDFSLPVVNLFSEGIQNVSISGL